MSETEKWPDPTMGIGDLLKLGMAIEEAITSGATTIPALDIRVHGQKVELGPCPVKVKP